MTTHKLLTYVRYLILTMEATRFVSRQEAAVRLGVPVAVVDRLIATGAVDRYLIADRYVRLLRSQVDELARMPTEWLALA